MDLGRKGFALYRASFEEPRIRCHSFFDTSVRKHFSMYTPGTLTFCRFPVLNTKDEGLLAYSQHVGAMRLPTLLRLDVILEMRVPDRTHHERLFSEERAAKEVRKASFISTPLSPVLALSVSWGVPRSAFLAFKHFSGRDGWRHYLKDALPEHAPLSGLSQNPSPWDECWKVVMIVGTQECWWESVSPTTAGHVLGL